MGRTFVIGDIHGHLTAFNAVLRAIALTPADTLITLGDYIDRGPDSKGVLDRLLQLPQTCTLIPLLGNHEEMMLIARTRARNAAFEWLMNGGEQTLNSYANPIHQAIGSPPTLDTIPLEHWRFLTSACRDFHETETHLFVHAFADPQLPLKEQTARTLRWERFNDPPPHISGKILICGHTPQKSGFPRYIGHALCLDTGIHVGRHLTCLEIETGKITQANPAGVLRTSELEDHRVR